MVTAVLIVVVLTIAASLASWLFGQWLATRNRVSGAALAIGGSGALVMIGTAAFVIIVAATSWQKLMPVMESSPLIAPARSSAVIERRAEPIAQAQLITQTAPPVDAIEQQRMLARKQEMLAAAEQHLEQSHYDQAIDLAREYLAAVPTDAEMRSMLARATFAAEHPGTPSAIRGALAPEWRATECVTASRSDESSRWMLDNRCDRPIAVLFASCHPGASACVSSAQVSTGWSYEPAGVLMTGANDKPVPLRLGQRGPLVAPIFTIRDASGVRLQIRYLACYVSARSVLQALSDSSDAWAQERLTAALGDDACYSQVLDWTRTGQQLGKSPDALLRDGLD